MKEFKCHSCKETFEVSVTRTDLSREQFCDECWNRDGDLIFDYPDFYKLTEREKYV